MPARSTATALLALALVLPASTHAREVGIRAQSVEAPGATVTAIVTATSVSAETTVRITASGTRGARARCTGAVWVNPVRRTASRRCYLRLPARSGGYRLVARARRTSAGDTVAETGSRLIRARGPRSPEPLSWAAVDAIERCHNPTDRVWLTFDDGGSELQIRTILATLARNGVRGRFFFTGAWGEANSALLREVHAAGHLLGNHSFSHPPLGQASASDVLAQIDRGVLATTAPMLLRPPSGSGLLSTRLASLAARRGYRLCGWTVNTLDHRGATAERIVERIRTGDEITPPLVAGGNVLLHGAGEHTADALQQIIDAVRAETFELDGLDAPM